jgi:DNA topoisomerase-2
MTETTSIINNKKVTRTKRNVDDYETMTHVEHVLRVPDTYIGSAQPVEVNRYVYEDGVMKNRNIVTCEGIERIFLEILSNAVDNIISTRHMADSIESKKTLLSTRSPPVSVTVTSKTVTIKNGGEPIPVAPHSSSTSDKLILVPTLIFGQLLSSSNYDTSVVRVGAGRNGYGAKLTNIYSNKFVVKIGDPVRGQEFEAIWKNNMSTIEKCSATPGFVYDKSSQQWVTNATAGKRGKKGGYSGPAYVEVSYETDFSRFSSSSDDNHNHHHLSITENSDDIIGSFAKFVYDYSFTSKIPILFNSKQFDSRNPRIFANTYYPARQNQDINDDTESTTSSNNNTKNAATPADRAIVWYSWATKKETEVASSYVGKDALSKAIISGAISTTPLVEMIVLDTPDEASTLAFVNGLVVPEGVHIYEAITKVCAAIVAASPIAASASKNGICSITSSDVRSHVSIILNCHLPDPRFTSQTKQVLAAPKPKIDISPEVFKSVLTSSSSNVKWSMCTRLAETADMKARRAASKTDGKKKKRVNVDGASDANFAGTSKSHECTLWLTEGDSAAAYTAKRVDMLPGRKDIHGIYGLRGKFVNATSASTAMLLKNKEYVELKTLLGLVEGYDYSTPEAIKTLRYGRICIATDADDDGASIRALLINCFSVKWKSLVKSGVIAYLATPAIRVTNPKTGLVVERFYSDNAFYKWEASNRDKLKGLRVRHIKGLASSKDNDIKDDLKTAPTVHIVYDDSATNSLDLAFSSKRADDRKKWIEAWRSATATSEQTEEDIILEPLSRAAAAAASSTKSSIKSSSLKIPSTNRTVTAIINKDLAEYSFASLFRALANSSDGFKRSQRQAMWHCLNTWNFGSSDKDSIKVSRLSSSVAEATSYAHGEASMQGTIVTMAQDFTGSNNLPLLFPDGQFGSREGGPSSHGAPRYIYTKLNWCVPYIYSKEAMALVARRRVEGELVETEWIPCDISTVACNGTRGIATGWASFIPCHKPSEVVAWTINRIDKDNNTSSKDKDIITLKEPSIWYNGFSGENSIEETSGEGGGRSMVSKGRFKVLRNATKDDPTYDVEITEIPIGGLWIKNYSKWLDSLIDSNRLVDKTDNSTTEKPHFILKRFSTYEEKESGSSSSSSKSSSSLADKAVASAKRSKTTSSSSSKSYPPPPLTLESLKLVKNHPINNMVLVDEHGTPSKFKYISDILEVHYLKMRTIYQNIKKERIISIENELKTLSDRHALLSAIVSGKLVIFKRPDSDILADIKKFKLSEEIYDKLKMRDATADKIKEVEKKINDTKNELETVKTTPYYIPWRNRLNTFNNVLKQKNM